MAKKASPAPTLSIILFANAGQFINLLFFLLKYNAPFAPLVTTTLFNLVVAEYCLIKV